MKKQKGRVEAEGTSLRFPLYKHMKMQISHLNLDFVLLLLIRKWPYWRIISWFSRRANRNHDCESFRTFNDDENLKLQRTFENLFGHMLTSNWHFKLPSILPEIFKADRLQMIVVAKKYICYNCSSVGCLKCVQFHNWFRLH